MAEKRIKGQRNTYMGGVLIQNEMHGRRTALLVPETIEIEKEYRDCEKVRGPD